MVPDSAESGTRRVHRGTSKPFHWKRIGWIAAALIAGLVVLAALWLAWSWGKVGDLAVTSTSTSDAATTYALVGVDARSAAVTSDRERGARVFPDAESVPGERADAIVVLRVSDGKASLLAVPRDLLALSDTGRAERLATTWLRSPQAFANALCRVGPGIPIDHVVAVDYRALVELVDAAGGMAVTTPLSVRDQKAQLEPTRPGVNRLNGEQALAWVRSRDAEQLKDGKWQAVDSQTQRSVRAIEPLTTVAEGSIARAPWLAAAIPSVAEATRISGGVAPWDLTRLLSSVGAAGDPQEVTYTPFPGRIPFARLSPEGPAQIRAFTGSEPCRPEARKLSRLG